MMIDASVDSIHARLTDFVEPDVWTENELLAMSVAHLRNIVLSVLCPDAAAGCLMRKPDKATLVCLVLGATRARWEIDREDSRQRTVRESN